MTAPDGAPSGPSGEPPVEMPVPAASTVDDATAELIAALAQVPPTQRFVLGIAGCPGVGKSTVAGRVHRLLESVHPGRSVLVPMDGFHLAQSVLIQRGVADRKGAPHTFDAAGYVALLERIRAAAPDSSPIMAPTFRRDLEEPIAGSIEVRAAHRLVITEGNYLLHDADGWEQVRPALDLCWFVDEDPALRRRRLVARHVEFGRSPEAAEAWVTHSDDLNAALVEASKARADRIVRA